MRSPVVRLALTILLPLLVVLAGDHVLLPGMEELLGTLARRASFFAPGRTNMSIFALGITPVIMAYVIVELAAFLVPKWSGLRHGNPEGRIKLERRARIVAVVLGAFQAWSVAQQIAGFDRASGLFATAVDLPSAPLVVATLVGGLCVQIVVAEIISRQGIANGYVLLVVIEALAELRGTFLPQLHKAIFMETLGAKHVVLLVLVVALPAAATWIALRGARRERDTKKVEGSTDGPYRAARALVVSPWVPVPASSIAPYSMAIALIGVPYTLLLAIGASRSSERYWHAIEGTVTYPIVLAVLTGALALGFAKLLHRPREMAEVASRLGFAGGEETTSKAAAALAATRVPTLLFFATLLLATTASGALPAHLSIATLPLLVAVVMDVGPNLRAGKLVAVWQERRASAVPVVRAVLAAEGIETTARGMNVLSLLQAFAPYAPAEIMVAEADAERATAVLRHVFLGEKRPEAEPREVVKVKDVNRGWSPSRRNMALGIAAGGALAVLGLANLRTTSHEGTKGPPPRLEVVLTDDEGDYFGTIRESDVPPDIELRFENAPVGPGRIQKVHFARTSKHEGESYEAMFRRMRAWCDTLVLPPKTRIGIEAVEDYDYDDNTLVRNGVRTFVLFGEPILRTEDIVEAIPSLNDTGGGPEVYVSITLSADAGERFRIATRDNVQRRFAIVVNDEINSVPVVKSEIGGGRLSITMGAGDVDAQLANAKKLARALVPEDRR